MKSPAHDKLVEECRRYVDLTMELIQERWKPGDGHISLTEFDKELVPAIDKGDTLAVLKMCDDFVRKNGIRRTGR